MPLCPYKYSTIGLSSLCIAPVFVPKVKSGERVDAPKVKLGEQRVLKINFLCNAAEMSFDQIHQLISLNAKTKMLKVNSPFYVEIGWTLRGSRQCMSESSPDAGRGRQPVGGVASHRDRPLGQREGACGGRRRAFRHPRQVRLHHKPNEGVPPHHICEPDLNPARQLHVPRKDSLIVSIYRHTVQVKRNASTNWAI